MDRIKDLLVHMLVKISFLMHNGTLAPTVGRSRER